MVVADREPDPQHLLTFHSIDFVHGVWVEIDVVQCLLGCGCTRCAIAGANLSIS